MTSPNPLTIQEALYFHRALRDDGISTAAVIVNRVQRDPRRHGGPDNIPALREALQLAQIKDAGAPPLSERLCQTLTEQASAPVLGHGERVGEIRPVAEQLSRLGG